MVEDFPKTTFALPKIELKHAAVLRIKNGDQVRISDGQGQTGVATVVSLENNELLLLSSKKHETPKIRIHVVQALAKGDRDELAVQTCTELGATKFTAWQAQRSVSRWQGPKIEKGLARWQSIATEAMKQSHQSYVPEVSQFAADTRFDVCSQLLVLDPNAVQSLADIKFETEVTLVVGPEGGISESELSQLVTRGAVVVRLGESVLRTSTAAPAAIATIRTVVGWD